MRIIQAKYNGKCCDCGCAIRKGERIAVVRKGAVKCSSCIIDERADLEEDNYDEREWPPSPSVLASDRRLFERGLSVTRFPSGAVVTQNRRGRCIDAPCCGCCS